MHSPLTRLELRTARWLALCLVAVALIVLPLKAHASSISEANTGSLRLNPPTINFGNVQVGTMQTQTETLTNNGSGYLRIYQATVSGSGFSTSGLTTPLQLSAGQSYTFSVMFSPQSAGSASGSVAFSSKKGTMVTLPLSGAGTSPGTLSASPTSIDFGSVAVGNTSSQGGSLIASGASVTVTVATSNNPAFTISGLSFPVTVSPGVNVPFTVNFAPQTTGTISGSLTFTSTAANGPAVQSLSGMGVSGSHEVGLKWDASTSEVLGYNVYRGTISGGPYTKINSALDPITTYIDISVSGETTYYYVTTAVDSDGDESSYSNEVEAVVP